MKPRRSAALGQFSLALAIASSLACSREAEVQKGDPFLLPDNPVPQLPDGGVPSALDGQLAAPELLPCLQRPMAPGCSGSNDFPCRVSALAPLVVADCQAEIPCRATDWLTLSIDGQGCFSDIGMTRPDPALLACLVRVLGEVQCPCGPQTLTQYLGFSAGICDPADAMSSIADTVTPP